MRKKRGKIGKKLAFLRKKLCNFRFKTFIFCIFTLVAKFLGDDHQYVSNYLLYFAMELFLHHFHKKIYL